MHITSIAPFFFCFLNAADCVHLPCKRGRINLQSPKKKRQYALEKGTAFFFLFNCFSSFATLFSLIPYLYQIPARVSTLTRTYAKQNRRITSKLQAQVYSFLCSLFYSNRNSFISSSVFSFPSKFIAFTKISSSPICDSLALLSLSTASAV